MKKIVLFMALGAMVASCSQDDNVVISDAEQYTRDFVKEFGTIDSKQDWNMVDRYSVNVTGSANNVEIYAKVDDAYRCVGHYTSVSGSKALAFDAPKGCTDFYVYADGKGFSVSNGQSIDLNSSAVAKAPTRTYVGGTNDVVTAEEEYKTFDYSVMTAWSDICPEGGNNADNDKLISSYDMIAKDGKTTFTVYPIYWNTRNTHVLGIYWYDSEGNMQKQPFYQDKEGDELKIHAQRGSGRYSYKTYVSAAEGWNENKYSAGYECTTVPYGYTLLTDDFQSKGFKITLPEGTRFGFYIVSTTDDTGFKEDPAERTHTIYSDSKLNGNKHMASFMNVTTADGTERTYLGFEDWWVDGNIADLNDLVVLIDPAPEVINTDDMSYVIAAEDLGSTNDFDFNDVVFSVTYKSGETSAYVTALAAGGTLPVQLYRDGQAIGGEFHSWFGDGTIPSTTMINTTAYDTAGKTVEITIPTDFSLTLNSTTKASMGNFSVVVNGENNIYGPSQTGVAPQMICVPYTWQWPLERTRISEAYPNFGEWGANYTKTDWVNNPVEGKVVVR